MRLAVIGFLLTAAVMIAASCGGRQNPRDERKLNDITALSAQIREWRRESGMSLDPNPRIVRELFSAPVQQAKAVCPGTTQVNSVCADVCTLAEHICDNAEQICILADDLGDQWSRDKCNSAKASCRDAKKRCCQCSEPTKASFAW